MKLATIYINNSTHAARVEGDQLVVLDSPDVGSLLASCNGDLDSVRSRSGNRMPLAGTRLAPVVPKPQKIICLGHNYLSHIKEMGAEPPSHPTLFAKFARCLIGPRDPIVLPAVSQSVDWEAELAFVIGREVRHANQTDALAAICGYTVLNDVSVRDWQRRTKQWLQGKTFESTTPVGPVLVTPDEVDHARDLEVRCEVDGQLMQQARTSDLLFRPAAIVAYVSDIITLEPGDIISTGTTAGVGAGRNPPVFLRPGQIVRTSIEGIGELVNECVPEQCQP